MDEIKELIEIVDNKKFNEFELEIGGFRLRLRKGSNSVATDATHEIANVPNVVVEGITAGLSSSASAPGAVSPAVPVEEEEELHLINSPIVGTFYRSPSPTADAFVKLGDSVEAGKTLCIIEAMKLMNEIQSDASGTVTKVFVENGQPVEYGQPLFGIKL